MTVGQFNPRFVETVPEVLDAGVLYVSMSLGSAIHLCACGCGREVITPLSPTDWKLCFDGENVTLEPSIGNWSFPCRAHYWIRGGRVRWARSWTAEEIADKRANDREGKTDHYRRREIVNEATSAGLAAPATDEVKVQRLSLLRRIWHRLTCSG